MQQKNVLCKLQDHLTKSGCKFVCGNSLTIADYVLFSELWDTSYLKMDLKACYPRLAQYQQDVMECSNAFEEMHTSETWCTIQPFIQNFFKIPIPELPVAKSGDTKPILTYFGVYGLAEPARMMLHHCKREFIDEVVKNSEWPELKKNKFCGRSLPVFTLTNGE